MSIPVKILTFRNEFEAMILDEILNEKGIPHLLRSYHDSAYNGLWQTKSSWGHIEAPEEYREQILQIYNEVTE